MRNIDTVFLDRDGVLNEKLPEGKYVTRWSEFRLFAGVEDAIARLNRAEKLVLVVSNQRGVALGHSSVADVNAIHAALQQHLAAHNAHIDEFFICPHDKNQCNCRKPLPGLFEQAAHRFPQIRAERSVMIGDALSDIEFGSRLGLATVFIDCASEDQKPGASLARERADLVCSGLQEAVAALLSASDFKEG
jgi:D-glycero-D-manno-heptose 1,7-bisphosphate phosphatase